MLTEQQIEKAINSLFATTDQTRICKDYSSSAKPDGVAVTPDIAETYYSHLMEWAV